jgi:hypothetical protein
LAISHLTDSHGAFPRERLRNDEGPYPYYSYIRHNQLLSGSWGYGAPPISDQDDYGCSPWLNRAAVCYPQDFGPSSVPNPAANVTTPNP